MRFASAALLAAMAASSSLSAASATPTSSMGQKTDDELKLQQELLQLASAMKEIAREQSWSADSPLSTLSKDTNSFSASLDYDRDATEWMERKEEEVQRYFTSDDAEEERRGRRSAMAQSDTANSQHFRKMDGGRRHLRVVSTTAETEQQTPQNVVVVGVERELGRGVGMKRSDPRAAGRFERTPPKGRDQEPSGSDGSGTRTPKKKGVDAESSEDDGPSTTTGSRTQGGGGRGSYVARRKSAKSRKPPPPPPPPVTNTVYVQPPPPQPQPFPNAVYVQHPPIVVKEAEVEECYDMEELEAMGIQFTTTRSVPPVYRYDGTLLNNHQTPGGSRRRSLQYYQHPYTYWTWNAAKSNKSAKNAPATNVVYVTPPQQTVYVGQQPPLPPPPLPPQQQLPPPPLPLFHLKSKSSKSKSGKMTKSGKTCIDLPPPSQSPALPSICGTDLTNAGSNCDSPCITDADCNTFMGEMCIPNVAACAAPGYCGTDVDDASKCSVLCTSDAGCPSGESCFLGGVVQCDDALGYCGSNVLDASVCAVEDECMSDGDCPGGESCYSKEVVECRRKGYCGSNVLDASKCAVECTSDGDCPSGESCFGVDGSDVITCISPGYCGTDADDATKCTTECTSNGDCPGGESCFTGGVECKPGHCGTDADDASKCEVPCSSNAGCPSGESCFIGTQCTAETRCPAGCPDCDPDSPLPCPPRMMKQVCDKQNDALYPPGDPKAGERISNFRDCYDMCKPSFCCIHASLSKEIAPTCAKEYENCPLYYPCYIIWWKLHDTIGPAPYLRVEQKEPFFNVKLNQLEDDFERDPTFFNQLFGHHFDTDDPLMDDMFKDPDSW